MNIGFFGVEAPIRTKDSQHDRPYARRLLEIIGPHKTLASFSDGSGDDIYFNTIAAKIRACDLDAIICTDANVMKLLVESLPDFKPSFMKNGQRKRLTLNDYHGSFFQLAGASIGRDRPVDVLVLNPLEHLRTVPEAPFIFKRFVSKITKPDAWWPQTEFKWTLATPENIEEIYDKFKTAKLIAVDIETDDSDLRTINCSGYGALFPDGTFLSLVIPIKDMWGVQWMRRFNQLPAPKIFQNGLYDNLYFLRYNSPVTNWLYDTQHLFHSWYSELPKRLDFLSAFALRNVRYWKDDGKSGGLQAHYEYNARDTWATLNAWCSLLTEAPAWAIKNYLQEFPLVFPCLHVEADGMSVDFKEFDASKAEIEAVLSTHEGRLNAWISPKFNPGSSPQCKALLKVLGCADKSGEVKSADDKALTAAAAAHPLNALILEEIQNVRKYRKLLSTYLVKEKFWNDRLYYKLNPAGTDTGRLASSESSFWCGLQIQNMPRGREVKRFLRADAGWLLGENDFAQSEARCVGYLSGCKSLIELVEGPHDYHAWNAQAFFGVPYEQIYDEARGKTLNKPLRDLSKRTNHGANYNMGEAVMLETMGPKAVAEARRVLGLPQTMPLLAVCKYLLDQYARTYPEVKKDLQEWIKRTISLTKKMTGPLGWTRYFFSDPSASKPALNAAVAHGPQNLSVGIINRVFYQIWRASVYGELKGIVRLKAQIHDSILYAYKGEGTPEILQKMMRLPVPVTDIKGVTRTMVIPPDISAGKTHWSMLK
jgi:hypothetical protein